MGKEPVEDVTSIGSGRQVASSLAWATRDHEAALLGALLLSEDAQHACIPRLSEDCFTNQVHKSLYKTIASMYEQGLRIDSVLIRSHSPSIRGDDLLNVQDACLVVSNYPHYLRCVIQDHDSREIARGASEAALKASAGEREAAEKAWDAAQARLLGEEDATTVFSASDLMDAGTSMVEAYAGGERAVLGYPTGWPGMDRLTSGLVPGNVIVVAARPGMGKSMFGSNLMVNVARDGQEVVLFSLEMTAQEIAMRLLCRESKVNWQALRDGLVADQRSLMMASERLHDLPMTVVDDSRTSLGTMHTYCRTLHPQVLIVDYVQLVRSASGDSRQEEVAAVSRGLKMLAKEHGLCVVALAQLNRNVEMRGEGASPQLSDLRDSGSLEQDADVVMFLKPGSKWLNVMVAKNRNGPAGQFELLWQKEHGDLMDETQPRSTLPGLTVVEPHDRFA